MTHLPKFVTEMRSAAEGANKVSRDWKLDHDDTYVGANNVLAEHNWYWVTGVMEMKDDGYNYPSSDEDLRGPKPITQAHCRHIFQSNPENVLKLISCLDRAIEALDWIANHTGTSEADKNGGPSKIGLIDDRNARILIARDALKEIEGKI